MPTRQTIRPAAAGVLVTLIVATLSWSFTMYGKVAAVEARLTVLEETYRDISKELKVINRGVGRIEGALGTDKEGK